jgi:hypothetical protein
VQMQRKEVFSKLCQQQSRLPEARKPLALPIRDLRKS